MKKTIRDPFEKENTDALKGICAVAIIFRHLIGMSNDTITSQLFSNGFLYVGVFFLISGYGWSNSLKKGGTKYILAKRFVKLGIPFGIIFFLRLILYWCNIYTYNYTCIRLGTFVPYSWYVYAITFFYIIYFMIHYIKKREYRVCVFAFILVIYVYICAYILKDIGISWYMTVGALFLGVLLGEYPEIKDNIIKNDSVIILICALSYAVFLSFYDWADVNSCILQNFTVSFFGILMLLASAKVNIVNVLTQKLGQISYEMYLIQGLISYLVYKYMENFNSNVVIIIVVLFDIIFAGVIHKIDKKLIKSILKR